MTPDTILHIARSDYAMMITEVGDNEGFKAYHSGSRTFTAAMKEMGWKAGEGWCNYWANSVWWRAFAPSLPDELIPILRRALDDFLQEKDSLGLWETKPYLMPLRALGMNAVTTSKFLGLGLSPKWFVPGSLVMFSCSSEDDNEKGREDHIGIGIEFYQDGIICLEGNAGDALRTTYRTWESGKILGWITPMLNYPEWNNYVLPTPK